MKKLIIAQQLDGEYFDYEAYYGEEQAACDRFWAGGNRDFSDFNADLKKDVEKALDNCGWDLENGIDEDMSEEEKNEERLSICKYYFKDLTENKLTDEQFYGLGNLSIAYRNVCSREELDIICGALEVLHGEPFVNGTIRGCSQGDWMEYIAPKSMASEYISWIEAILFGTGTEFKVSIIDVGEDVDLTNADKLIELADSDDNSYSDYTDLWNDDSVKEWIAKNASYGESKFTKDDVILVTIDSYRMVKVNTYKVA